jgi:DNA-binding CsgD family transcriptional regulator
VQRQRNREKRFDWNTVFSYQNVGFAFIIVWSSLVFLSQGFLAPPSAASSVQLLCFIVSLSALILVLFLVALFPSKVKRYTKQFFVTIPLIFMEAGTFLIIVGALFGTQWALVVLVIGSILTGIGSGLMNLSWGIAFSTISTSKILVASAALNLFAGILRFSFMNLPTYVIIFIMLICPIVSVLIFKSSNTSMNAPTLFEKPRKVNIYSKKILLVSLIYGFVIGAILLLVTISYPEVASYTGVLWFASSIVFFLVICLVHTYFKGFSFNGLYKVGVLLISLSVILTLLIDRFALLTLVLILFGEVFIRAFIWASLAILSHKSITPVFAFGIGWGGYQAGLLGGHLFILLYVSFFIQSGLSFYLPISIALVIIVLLTSIFGLSGDVSNDTPEELELTAQTGLKDFDSACETLIKRYHLSQSESDIFRLLVQSMSSKEIQSTLVISAGTVNTHMAHIYKKLAVHSRKEAIALLRKETGELEN